MAKRESSCDIRQGRGSPGRERSRACATREKARRTARARAKTYIFPAQLVKRLQNIVVIERCAPIRRRRGSAFVFVRSRIRFLVKRADDVESSRKGEIYLFISMYPGAHSCATLPEKEGESVEQQGASFSRELITFMHSTSLFPELVSYAHLCLTSDIARNGLYNSPRVARIVRQVLRLHFCSRLCAARTTFGAAADDVIRSAAMI